MDYVDSNGSAKPKRVQRRKQGQGSLAERADGRWDASINMPRDPSEGKGQKRVRTTKRNKKEAEKWLRTIREHRDDALDPALKRRDSPGHHVYFIQGITGGPVKIGTSTNVDYRFKVLRAHSPIPLKVLHVIEDGGKPLEEKLHQEFRLYRLHGEWFENTEKLMRLIEVEKNKAKQEKLQG